MVLVFELPLSKEIEIIMRLTLFLIVSSLLGCTSKTENKLDSKENTWVFIMAGQSNMAGRGTVEPQDTITNPRILSIDSLGNWKAAQEPLHFYEPTRVGLDCGMSFAKELMKYIPEDVTIAMIPTAVGGSAIDQWINDETYRDVALLANLKSKTDLAKEKGVIKGILWHQGESDAYLGLINKYASNMEILFDKFRQIADHDELPIIVGELGSFFPDQKSWNQLNDQIQSYANKDNFTEVISTSDLNHKGDSLHFDAASQRKMGERFAKKYLELTKNQQK